MILETKCPKCNKTISMDYTTDKTKEDIYYSLKEFMFICPDCLNPNGYRPYMFHVPGHKVLVVEEQSNK